MPKKRPKKKKQSVRRAKPQSSLSPLYGATTERKRQNGGIIEDQVAIAPNSIATNRRHRAACECQLDAYRQAGKIDEAEHAAGLQFRTAWLFKAHKIRTIDSTSGMRIDGSNPLTPEERLKQLNWAEKTLQQAFKEADLSIAQTLVVTKVCGTDDFVGDAGDIRTLRRGLEKLARFWGFS